MRLMPNGSPSRRSRMNSRDSRTAGARSPNLAQPRAQGDIGRSPRPVTNHLAIGGNHVQARRSLISNTCFEKRDSLALRGGPHQFFDNSSFSAALSSIASAKSFFSLPFSSSSDFSRFASETVRPAVLGLPVVQRRIRDAVLAGEIASLRTKLVLLQNRDDLLFRKSAALHQSVLSSGRTLIPSGGKSQWQVTSFHSGFRGA